VVRKAVTRALATCLGLAALAVAVVLVEPRLIADPLAGLAGERIANRVRNSLLHSDDLRVVVCGSGTPQADPDRVGACLAVIAAGHVILVDSGYGSTRQLDLDGVPLQAVRAVFLTHLHSDHITDLAELVNRTWRAGRSERLAVQGPPGTVDTVDGFMLALKHDLVFRELNVQKYQGASSAHGPLESAAALGREFTITDPDARPLIWERDGLRVYAFFVDHAPVRPAYGYRIEYGERSVTISGDTRYYPRLSQHAANSDLLFHEVYAKDFVERAMQARVAAGDARMAAEARAVMDYHTAPLEVAQIAKAGAVGCLVLTHVIPPLGPAPLRWVTRRLLTDGMDDVFGGPIVVARDGMEFQLPQAKGTDTHCYQD
jgi:ribonuclease Z